MRHHAPSPAYLNIFEFRLFQGNASWRHHNLRSLSILTEAYCPPLWYKEGMFFPCVVESLLRRKNIFQPPCHALHDARNFQMQRVSRRSHREQYQVGKQDFRTQAHVPNKMRHVWNSAFAFHMFKHFQANMLKSHILCVRIIASVTSFFGLYSKPMLWSLRPR